MVTNWWHGRKSFAANILVSGLPPGGKITKLWKTIKQRLHEFQIIVQLPELGLHSGYGFVQTSQ